MNIHHKISKFSLGVALSAMCALNVGAAGFKTSGTKLLDANGNEFIMRGVNHPHAWYKDKLNTAIPAIAATGANTVRVVMATGDRWTRTSATEVRTIINKLKEHNLVAVLEVHDCTGYSEQSGSVDLSKAVDYWLSADIKAELMGEEAYVIINIANEPFGNNVSAEDYLNKHKTAITQLRSAGYTHALMVDAANWGQDWQNTMRDNAGAMLNYDPDKNIIFSVHMYDVYNTEAKVKTYLQTVKNAGVHLVVGEFADSHGDGKPVAAEAILRLTVENDQGYLGWSWVGNGSGLEMLDIAQNWNGSPLTTWGNLLVNNANGLKAKGQVASVFTGVTPPKSSSSGNRPGLSSSSQQNGSSSSVGGGALPAINLPPATGNFGGFDIWYTYVDAIGSQVMPDGSKPLFVENGATVAMTNFSIMPEPTYQAGVTLEYPYVGMALDFAENGAATNKTGTTGISLTYKSAGAVRMSIAQAGIPGGQEWGYDLPASTTYRTLNLTWSQLSQPDWVDNPTALDLTQIKGIKWELKESAGGSGSIAINAFALTGAGGTTAIKAPVAADINWRINGEQLSWNMPRAGVAKVEVFNYMGQKVFSHRAEYGAGTQGLALPHHLVRPIVKIAVE